jgi:hypothetical protein
VREVKHCHRHGVQSRAFACHVAEPATIGDGQVARIKDVEAAPGVSLVAVKG